MGRRRTKGQDQPAGTREIDGVWYWQPTTQTERAQRRKLRQEAMARGERFTIGCTLGPARSTEARKKWAEVSGFADAPAKDGTFGQLSKLWKDARGLTHEPNGKARSPATTKSYKHALQLLEAQFAGTSYGKTEFEASRGRAIGTVNIQRFVRSCGSEGVANIALAVAKNIFNHAIREGFTTYNPCDKAVKNDIQARTREPLEWEIECLRALARPLVGLIMDYEGTTGDRIGEILAVLRAHLTADGIRVLRKGNKWETWEWSTELRRIDAEAALLPGATPFPKSPLFPSRRGTRLSYSGWNTAWKALVVKTNCALADGIIEPRPDGFYPTGQALSIEGLHFHDGRSKVHDDAEDKKEGSGAEQIGDSKAVAVKHYARREKRKRPLK